MEEVKQTTELDLLAEDLSQTNTDYDMLPDGVRDMEISSVTKETVEDPETGNYDVLVVKMLTKEAFVATNTKNTVQAGFPCTTKLFLAPRGKMTNDMVKRSLAQFVQSTTGVTSIQPLDAWKGRVCRVKVTTQPETDRFAASNRFRFVPLK